VSDRSPSAPPPPSPRTTGDRLRRRRTAAGLSLREFARRVGVSASTVSQIERGLISPSVATLYAFVQELGMSLDELFAVEGVTTSRAAQPPPPRRDDPGDGAPIDRGGRPSGGLVRRGERPRIAFSSGVTWERLTAPGPAQAEFLYVVYPPRSTSSRTLMRHKGREFGHVLRGRLEVTLGFDRHVLEAGDSIRFDCTQPHRLAALGDEAAHAIWFVAESEGDVTAQHD